MHTSKSETLNIPTIGVVRSTFADAAGTPIQPSFSNKTCSGQIELFKEYEAGLKDLDGFSHIAVFYLFHKITESKLVVTPFLDKRPHGIFATRSPARPSRLGFSVLPLLQVVENVLHVSHLDILDGTPVLDIKPFVPEFDVPREPVSIGWYETRALADGTTIDDGRFLPSKK